MTDRKAVQQQQQRADLRGDVEGSALAHIGHVQLLGVHLHGEAKVADLGDHVPGVARVRLCVR